MFKNKYIIEKAHLNYYHYRPDMEIAGYKLIGAAVMLSTRQ